MLGQEGRLYLPTQHLPIALILSFLLQVTPHLCTMLINEYLSKELFLG